MSFKPILKPLVGCLPLGLMLSSASLAQTALVDFVSADAASGNVSVVSPSVGSDFTGAVAVETVALIDYATGATTGWTLSITPEGMEYRTGSSSKAAGEAVTGGDALDTFDAAYGATGAERWDGVMRADENYGGTPSVTFLFTGLTASATYDLAFLHNYRTGTSSDKYATATLTNPDGTFDGASVSAPTRYNDAGAMLAFDDVTAGVDGTLSVTVMAFDPGVNPDFYLQGLSLTENLSAVPEPAETAALIGLVGLGFGFWRRRRATLAGGSAA
ncbi:PEP-CTERM sorting domain-containing protein [Actomonas aquatica]|uniref:PEP-CTERM sorting domain-containing protein n=1 Tax=Actomonas aquatica TaxID=2866162 RepID=A0ABZ1C6F2_9BACT|nr:PEP-CTERM sorting domain-containing protein [Opitutus sp. WL0086]WRQ85890.1 PEP-CTERM sorting domain-containing protein [Opitutus sp. WL0086]